MSDPPAVPRPEADLTRALKALGAVPLFASLPEEMRREAAGLLEERRIAKGDSFYRQGRRQSQAFSILLSGRVRILQERPEGPPRILGYRGPGDVLGALPMLTGGPALTTSEAVLDSVALALPQRAFHTILNRHPDAALGLARLLGRRLQTFTALRGRRRTRVFLGVATRGRGPRESLLALGVARALGEVTGANVLVLDFAYGGALTPGTGPGLARSLGEVLDGRGHACPELLSQRVLRADERLSYLIFETASGALDAVDPAVFPELLGVAKGLASYVVVRLPPEDGPGRRKLVGQLEHVVVGLGDADLAGGEPPAWLGAFPASEVTAGALHGESEAPLAVAEFRRRVGLERDFHFPCPADGERGLARLSPYPREALREGEEAVGEAKRVVRRLTRRRLGLCLGSGTALGWAHIGVLKVLRREGIPFDCLAGSSMGSIIASMVACEFGQDEMEAMARSITKEVVDSWADYNWPMMRDGLVRGEAATRYLESVFGDRRIEELNMPLLIQATDLLTGRPYYFRRGRVVDAIRASVSLPGVFRPVEYDGRLLVDGGVHDTLPTAPLRELGADLVLAVNTTQSPHFNHVALEEAKGYNVFDIFLRSLEIMQTRRTGFEGQRADLVLQPEIQGANWREMWRAEEILPFGEAVAEANLDAIYALLRRPPV